MNVRANRWSVLRLAGWQGRGRLRRIGCRFLLPRRMVLSLLAILLAAVWLGNAVMTVWLREPATPQLLRAMVGFGLAFYAIWHLALVACFRPRQCLEWIESERIILEACPLRSSDLLTYHLVTVAMTTLLKAAVLTMLLLPDLGNVPIAMAGIVLAMLLLELWRMAVEIVAWGMNRRGFIAFRFMVGAALCGLCGAVATNVAHSPLIRGEVHLGSGVMNQLGQLLIKLDASVVGAIQLPFRPFLTMISANEITGWTIGSIGLALAMILLAGSLVFWLFALMPRWVSRRERAAYQPGQRTNGSSDAGADYSQDGSRPERPIGRLGPMGAIAWRQWLGARRVAGSLLTALVIPGIMAMAPIFVIPDPLVAFLSTAGALAFYTFLLLPTALRFDFRRDLDRLETFKSLPISARKMAVGQLLTPVLISTLFQAVVLALSAIVHGQSFPFYIATVLVLLPMNILVFALDNLIFLLYPYRAGQEGLDVFLRTMLTFTGKGLLFVLGLGMISVWGYGAARIAQALSSQLGTATDGYSLFAAGLMLGMCMISCSLVFALQHAYDRLNPVEDIPR
jgi:hypothetical protein